MRRAGAAPVDAPAEDEPGPVARAVLDVVAAVPRSSEPGSATPQQRAEALARQAAARAARLSGSAALLPGPLGLLTLLPDLVGVWRIQAQLVSDIAAAYGQSATLGREQMLYCLFRHLASQGLRDLVVRAGERFLVRRASLQVLQRVAGLVGLKLTQRTVGKAVARWAPLVGAAGVAAYAWRDTRQVADTAIELFNRGVVIEAEGVEVIAPAATWQQPGRAGR